MLQGLSHLSAAGLCHRPWVLVLAWRDVCACSALRVLPVGRFYWASLSSGPHRTWLLQEVGWGRPECPLGKQL